MRVVVHQPLIGRHQGRPQSSGNTALRRPVSVRGLLHDGTQVGAGHVAQQIDQHVEHIVFTAARGAPGRGKYSGGRCGRLPDALDEMHFSDE
jgi:hypothetical protein